MVEIFSEVSLWELVKHIGRWLANLNRAQDKRKLESIDALRRVVVAARKTAVYMRQLQESGRQSHKTEAELSVLWTELGFALEDLGIEKLAKRCRIKGRQWAQPSRMDKEYLEKADVGLERMEQLANQLLRQIKD
jgi:hypothetical protein